MGLMTLVFVVFILAVALGMFLFLGGDSGNTSNQSHVAGLPPDFNPSLAYMEKYGETGIAYDQTQKLLCILHRGEDQWCVVSPANILAAAITEDCVVLERSARTDEHGNTLMTSLLTDESQSIFKGSPEAPVPTQDRTIKPTTQAIELKILINDLDNPVKTINFLNMEAKKGGILYNEASNHAKNWQELLGFLIRIAEKTSLQTSGSTVPQNQPVPAPAGQTS